MNRKILERFRQIVKNKYPDYDFIQVIDPGDGNWAFDFNQRCWRELNFNNATLIEPPKKLNGVSCAIGRYFLVDKDWKPRQEIFFNEGNQNNPNGPLVFNEKSDEASIIKYLLQLHEQI